MSKAECKGMVIWYVYLFRVKQVLIQSILTPNDIHVLVRNRIRVFRRCPWLSVKIPFKLGLAILHPLINNLSSLIVVLTNNILSYLPCLWSTPSNELGSSFLAEKTRVKPLPKRRRLGRTQLGMGSNKCWAHVPRGRALRRTQLDMSSAKCWA